MLYVPNFIPEHDPSDGLISRASMARYILRLMAEDYSQTHFLVSWDDEMPFRLWQDAHGEVQEAAFGETRLSERERKLILELAHVADGWWLDVHNPESVVSMDQWREILAKRSPL